MHTSGTPTASRKVPVIACADIITVFDPTFGGGCQICCFWPLFSTINAISVPVANAEQPVNIQQNRQSLLCFHLTIHGMLFFFIFATKKLNRLLDYKNPTDFNTGAY